MKIPKIKTSHVRPPIPTRRFDWCAWDDNLGEDASPTGYGRTEEEAVKELKGLIELRQDNVSSRARPQRISLKTEQSEADRVVADILDQPEPYEPEEEDNA